MGFLTSLLRSLENPRRPLDPWAQLLGGDGLAVSSGVRVNRPVAMGYAAFWRAVNLIASTVAKLPLGVYRRVSPGIEVDHRHPAHRRLRLAPNSAMTAFTWKETLQAHALVLGNGYSYIARLASGDPDELLILDPERTYPVRENGELWYLHQLQSGEWRKLPAADILHLKGLGHDGLIGYSVLELMAEEVGLAVGMRKFASIFFENNARPNVVLVHPGKLSPEARRHLRESWQSLQGGLSQAHRTAILEEGMQAKELSINAADAQLLESRQFSLLDIANRLGIPPHKLGAPTNVSYKSLEQENQAFLDDAIDPWLVRWEEECESKLLGVYQRERETHCIQFDRFPLVRADQQQRGAYYQQALGSGWMNIDEVRAREGLNPLPGGLGQVYYRPANLLPAQLDPDGPAGPAVAPGAKLLAVPDLRQEEDFDCGPAAVAAVCRFFGVGPSDRVDYLDELGTTAAGGTRPAAILDFLSRLGLAACAASALEVVDLTRFFQAGWPVLCPIQAGAAGVQTSGHWVVVTGTGLGQVFCQDPAVGPRMLTEEEWLSRWQDRDSAGTSYSRYGIAVGREWAGLVGPGSTSGAGEEEGPVKGEEAPAPDVPPGEDPPDGRATPGQLLRELALETFRRAVRRIGHHARRHAQKPEGFLDWLDQLGRHEAVLARMLGGVLAALAAARGQIAAPARLGEIAAEKLTAELRELLLGWAGEATAAELGSLVAARLEALERAPATLRAVRFFVGTELEQTTGRNSP